ncbi:MAG TPA: AAA family ATPase, partial [Gammaproteobacteria bacterium]|nr:AAA family ATPase [Gammaproteobacteria bacterium]
MLLYLRISNLAVVENLEIDFSSNMTVITGETGAGKSILLDALSLALGERADPAMIRPSCDCAEVTATFDISSLNGAILWLSDCDLSSPDPAQECVIRRILFSNGRSRAYINDKIVTTAQLRLLGAYLVQMHGQHQHQLLLNPHEHRRLVDAFGQHEEILNTVKVAAERHRKLLIQKQALQTASQNAGQLELLRYQVEELLSLDIKENEVAILSDLHQQLAHANEYRGACQEAINLLQGSESSTLSQLYHIEKLLPETGDDPNLSVAKDCIRESNILLEEVYRALKSFQDKIDCDPDKLVEVEQRLEKLFDIARKHK